MRLSVSDWKLIVGASLIQIMAACALRTMPLPAVRRAFACLRPLATFMLTGSDDRVIWSIEATGRRLGRLSTCLVRAIVVDVCLSTPERPLRLIIGVKRSCAGDLQSHAWVDDRRRILIGDADTSEFVPLVAWDSLVA